MLTKAALHRLRSLRDRKHRVALGLFVVEGEKVVGELLAVGFPLVELYATPEWPGLPPGRPGGFGAESGEDRSASVAAVTLTPGEMARASHFPTPSTVLAVGRMVSAPLAPGALGRGLTLALDGVQDPGNVGTLLRIADWYGLDRVVLSPDCADRFHQKTINASMGSFARMPAYTADLATVLADVPPDVPVLGCELAGDDVHALPALTRAVIVIGSEGRGLSPAVAACVTHRITIPRYGAAESLNAAVAAAIVCDNIRRLAPVKSGPGPNRSRAG